MLSKISHFEYINHVLERASIIIDELAKNNKYYNLNNIIPDLKKSEEKLKLIKKEKYLLSLILLSFSDLYKDKKTSIYFYVDSFNDDVYLDLIKESFENYKNISFSISKNTHYFNGEFYQINLILND